MILKIRRNQFPAKNTFYGFYKFRRKKLKLLKSILVDDSKTSGQTTYLDFGIKFRK